MRTNVSRLKLRLLITLCAAVFALGITAIPSGRVMAAGSKEDTINPGDVVKLNEDYSSYWFKLTVDKTGIYTIESEGIEDPKVILYESDKDTEIESADGGGVNYNFKLSRLLTKGTYWYRVYQKHFELLYNTTVKLTANTDDTILVRINSTDIPDDAFRTYIDENFDKINDDVIRAYETFDATTLDIHGMGITSLKGIEAFPELRVLYCSSNSIKSLDLRSNTKLVDLSCTHNPLESIDLSANTLLREVSIVDTNLKTLDISKNVELGEVFIHDNPKLTDVTIGSKPRMEYLDIENNAIEDLDLTGCTNLEDVKCGNNGMTSVNIKGLNHLYVIDLRGNYLNSLDLTGCENITTLYLSNNLLKKLDVSKTPSIRKLYCDNNRLESLNLSGCKQIYYLDCSENAKLDKIDISDSPFLVTVFNKEKYWDNTEKCYMGTIFNKDCFLKVGDTKADKGSVDYSEIVVSIDEAHFPDGQFRKNVKNKLDMDHDGKLSKLEIINATSIDVTSQEIADLKGIEYFSELASLICPNNSLTSIDLSKNTKLKTLRCNNNKLTSLDISKNTKLATFFCDSNKLTALDLSKNPALARVHCQKNYLTNIDISSNPLLLKAYKDGTASNSEGILRRNYRDLYYIWWDENASITTAKPTATPTSKPKATATPTVPATVKLTLDKKEANIVCGKTLTLKATLSGSTASVTWKSSDTKVATVSSSGKITAKMAGTVTITATASGKSAKCKVTVLYKDVTKTSDFWYAPTNYLTAKGVVKGYDNQTNFKPANKCTRAQMVTFIWRLQGEPQPTATTCKFKDVKKSDYFYKACIWGNEKGIVEGYKDGTFGPKIVCARKHAVTFLWRLAGKPAPKAAKSKFKDVKKSDYFYKATIWASENKILAGYDDGTFRPNGDCLRRQMVTFLYKYDKYITKSK